MRKWDKKGKEASTGCIKGAGYCHDTLGIIPLEMPGDCLGHTSELTRWRGKEDCSLSTNSSHNIVWALLQVALTPGHFQPTLSTDQIHSCGQISGRDSDPDCSFYQEVVNTSGNGEYQGDIWVIVTMSTYSLSCSSYIDLNTLWAFWQYQFM